MDMSSSTGRRWTAVAVFVWVALVGGLAVFSYRYPWSHTVYGIYSLACRHWWSGQDLYGAAVTDYYRYSPLFAISITGWALLPDSWGGALWRISSGLLYAAGLLAWARHVLPGGCSRSQRAAVFLLVLPLSVHSMQNGQANVVMLGALLLGLAMASAEKWNQAAAWFALATLIKGYPLALALLVAALYPRRFLFRYASALGLGLLLPFATQRPEFVIEQYRSWLVHLQESTTIMRERLRTVEHLFSIYGHPLAPHTFLMIQLLAGAAILGLCLFHKRRALQAKKGSGTFCRNSPEGAAHKRCLTPFSPAELRLQLHGAFQLFTCWVMLFGPATEACTYVVIAPVIAWSLVDAFSRTTPWSERLLLIASFLMMGPLVTDFAIGAIRDFANEHGSQPIGALLFCSYLLVQLTRARQVCYAEMPAQRAVPRDAAA